jgi:hypothetical protein
LITRPVPLIAIVPDSPEAKAIVSAPGLALAEASSPRRLPSSALPLS